jgi:hypothetical protein
MSTPKDRPLTPERERFLNLRHLPAQMTAAETAHYLGCIPHEIPVLVSKGFLKPLGNPADNAVKFFALATLEELRADVKWLSRARAAIYDFWRTKNAAKSGSSEHSSDYLTRRTEAASEHAV